MVTTYMGQDIQYTIRANAEHFVNTCKYDGKSRNFPYEVFTGRFKKACADLISHNMTEETKVMKFRAAFQVRELAHLHAIIQSNPNYSQNLENCIAFVGEQMRSMKQQNGTPQNRNLARLNTSNNKSKSKKAHKKWVNPKSKKFGFKGKLATKFDPANPGQYVIKSAWHQMSKAQKQSSRDARNAAQRAIQSIKTNAESSTKTLTASVAALTKKLDDITMAMEVDDEDPPPPTTHNEEIPQV